MKLLSPNPADPLSEITQAGPGGEAGADDLNGQIDVSDKVRAQIRLYVQRAAKVELERRILAGEYRKKADVQRENVRKIQTAKSALLDVPRAIAAKLVGLEREAIERVLEDVIRAILSDFAGRAGG